MNGEGFYNFKCTVCGWPRKEPSNCKQKIPRPYKQHVMAVLADIFPGIQQIVKQEEQNNILLRIQPS